MKIKKWIRAVAAAACFALLLTGCGNAIPEMTDEETKMVEEYAAHLLLSHSVNYKTSVLTEEAKAAEIEKLRQKAELESKVREEQEKRQQANAEQDGEEGEGSGQEAEPETYYLDIDEFLGLPDVDIDYDGYQVSSMYPQDSEENDWQGIITAAGNSRLVVFEYRITNKSGKDSILDLAAKDTKYAFKINGSLNKTPITTLLADDLANYRSDIPAGISKKAVLIVEVSGEVADNLESVQMVMKYNGEKRVLTIK